MDDGEWCMMLGYISETLSTKSTYINISLISINTKFIILIITIWISICTFGHTLLTAPEKPFETHVSDGVWEPVIAIGNLTIYWACTLIVHKTIPFSAIYYFLFLVIKPLNHLDLLESDYKKFVDSVLCHFEVYYLCIMCAGSVFRCKLNPPHKEIIIIIGIIGLCHFEFYNRIWFCCTCQDKFRNFRYWVFAF